MAAVDFETRRMNAFSVDDFDTASVRSAAPSYISEVPSYHTTVSTTETIPPYSPPQNGNANANANATTSGNSTPASRSLLPSHTAHIPSPGLPPIPPVRSSASDIPSLGAFRIPSWSVNTNPMYQRVATRRAQAAMSSGEGLMRNAARVLERVNEETAGSGSGSGSGSVTPEDDSRVRPLEDPYLVGEVAAARARRERLARENTEDILHREDRRWDWFLGQVNEREERSTSWRPFRRNNMHSGSRVKLARRAGTSR